MLTALSLEAILQPILEDMQLQSKHAEQIPAGLDVREWIKMARSLRRGVENDALENDTSKTTIELIHRWSAWERSRGAQPGFNMLEHYAQRITRAFNTHIFHSHTTISSRANNGYCLV